jgi:DNA-directed RNA polymerase
MSDVIRDTFIALHSSDVLTRLRQEVCSRPLLSVLQVFTLLSQFVERYKGYKVPLVQLATGQLLKQLRGAGVELEVTPEEANQLTLLRPLLKIVDPDSAETTVDDSQAEKKDVGDMITKVDTAQSEDGSAAALEDSASEGSEAEVDFEGLDEKLIKRLKRKTKADRDAAILRGKFVDVVDILPPLPKKGDFQVENIKASPYFFS